VIYEGLRAVQRRALHGRAAHALLRFYQGRPRGATEEVAYHFEQAGDPQAISYLTQAAQQAEELFAYQHATDLYSRALTIQRAQQSADLAGRFDLLLAREAVLDRQGRRTEQGEDIAELVTLAKALADNRRLAQAWVRQAGLLTYTGAYTRARRAGEQALALYRGLNDTRGEAQALRELGFLHWSTGDHATALRYGREALKLHRRLGDLEGEATALHNLAEIHRSLGSPRQALAQYEDALNLYWADQDRRRQGLTLHSMAHAWRQLGELDRALTHYQEASRHCEEAGDLLMISRLHHAMAGLYWEMGHKEQMLEHIDRALEISREIGYGPGIAHGLLAQCYVQAQRGEPKLARDQLGEALTWLRLVGDQAGLKQARILEQTLERGTPKEIDFPANIRWVKSHVALAEGKVYCEFESPIAQSWS
jgi:tetratricopeptide (TPR) repeat protein